MSVNAGRILITNADGNALYIFGEDGQEINCIKIADYMFVRYAVETSHNTYIVVHENARSVGDTNPDHVDGVSEVDVKGLVIRRFSRHDNTGIQLYRPHYFVLDASNHVIVADLRNERIVLLKPDLQFGRILIPSLQLAPYRLCLGNDTGLLFVTCMHSKSIQIYKILRGSIKAK